MVTGTFAMSETDKAYLAGMIDGEGCISITKADSHKGYSVQYRLNLIVTQRDKWILEHLRDKTGVGEIYQGSSTNYKGNYCTWHSWRISSRGAEILLTQIFDYLIVKKEQAEIAIRFANLIHSNKSPLRLSQERINEREQIYLKLKEIKHTAS